MAILHVSDVTVRFGGLVAVNRVTLSAEAGRITGLIGPNGAGKTTLFNVVSGLQAPSSGRIFIDDRDVTGLSVYRRARLGLARTFQRLETFGSLTVRENIMVAAYIRNRWSRERSRPGRAADAMLERIGLDHVADDPVESLPTGLARLTELGRARVTRPRILLLDEPGSGLDQRESQHLGGLLVGLASEQELAVLIVEHDMDLVMSVCDHIHVLDFGAHIAQGSPEDVRSDPKVQEAYLGTAAVAPMGGTR